MGHPTCFNCNFSAWRVQVPCRGKQNFAVACKGQVLCPRHSPSGMDLVGKKAATLHAAHPPLGFKTPAFCLVTPVRCLPCFGIFFFFFLLKIRFLGLIKVGHMQATRTLVALPASFSVLVEVDLTLTSCELARSGSMPRVRVMSASMAWEPGRLENGTKPVCGLVWTGVA
jgi:hypothetical protein